MERITPSRRRELWEEVSKFLLKNTQPLPFNLELYEYFSRHFLGGHAWECLRHRWLVEQGDMDAVQKSLGSLSKNRRVKVLLYLSKVCTERSLLPLALSYAVQAYDLQPHNVYVLRRLISLHHRLGNITQRVRFLEQLKAQSGLIYINELESAQDEKLLQEHVWQWESNQTKVTKSNTIIHVWNKSYPEINGYTVRSMNIIKCQLDKGMNAVAVTRLGWPSNVQFSDYIHTMYDNVEHYHLYDEFHKELNHVPMSEYFQVYADRFAELLQRLQPKVIHAASNFQNALPPLAVARKLGIPSVYEVRGLWHYTQCSKLRNFEASERFQLHEQYELICCKLANRVVVICDSIRSYLVQHGISHNKIDVIYNGVNVVEFQPQSPCSELVNMYDLKGKLVIGFIGSIVKYEGLDILLKALTLLRRKRSDIKLLIVGDGPALSDLQQLSRALELDDIVTFVGRVPHKDIVQLYSVIDVLPFPRTRDKVCQLVTPLKLYEAMAMGKAVLVSDIPALREMIIEGKTGMVFQPEDASSLAECLNQSHRFSKLGRKARRWVVQHRDWGQLIERYKEVYAIQQ